MASSAPFTQLRRLLQDRFSQITGDVEGALADARDRAQRELADQLNQAVRRILQSSGDEELAATLTDTAAACAAGAVFFRIENDEALPLRVRGVPDETAERLRGLRIPLARAAALAGAVESREPAVALTSASEVSPELVERLQHPADGRVCIFPIVVRERVLAVLYTWSATQLAVLELLAQVASAAWSSAASPPPPPAAQADLVQIAPAKPPLTWESLTSEEQQLHLRAQRFARVQIAELRLREADAVQRGRSERNLYGELRERIDAMRAAFRSEFFMNSATMVDYLHQELLRTLANEDGDVLGSDYPGPMA